MLSDSEITYLKDYKKPAYGVKTVDLVFDLDEEKTLVSSLLEIEPLVSSMENGSDAMPPLFLNGGEIELASCVLNGRELVMGEDYLLDSKGLTLLNPPKVPFSLSFKTIVNPSANTKLSGLYMSGGIFCTQCEAEGFRRITFYPDHPDVMAKFKVRINADTSKYPVLLSNGNLIEEGEGYVVWEDPFAKPSYLFALVAADYDYLEDSFVTKSNKNVTLRIYADKKYKGQLGYAMASLKNAMKWDEEAFGREYDLDLFNIVAVHDFNAGAMENKSLNIFSEKLVIADTDIATDMDYKSIESVIGHEYFHNWTGDRITARDWFNLSLKEGLTVFRDQEFSADMGSRAVQRINDVIMLRTAQFPEDAGPLAHPIRPASYLSIDNFYTATVYEKGAEAIRMVRNILGKDLFRKGMDLYFERYDGMAVTIDDLIGCMADVSGFDFTEFMRWYSQCGTPLVKAEGVYDEETKKYHLTLEQSYKHSPNTENNLPFVIPFRVGLIGEDGKDIPLSLIGESKKGLAGDVIILDEDKHTFVFDKVTSKPVLSINRDFSAPIVLDIPYVANDLAFIMKNDSDLFNKWEAGQKYALNYILTLYEDIKAGRPLTIDVTFFDSFISALDLEDKDFAALALRMPTVKSIIASMENVDVDALVKAHREARKLFARTFKNRLVAAYQAEEGKDVEMNASSAASRALRNQIIAYLGLLGDKDTDELIRHHYCFSPLMTNIQAALTVMVSNQINGFEDALGDIYWHYKDNSMVINRWFLIQALAEQNSNLLATVKKLTEDELFDFKNPAAVYSLIGAFGNNIAHFNKADGSGYAFMADTLISLDDINPAVAARMAVAFSILPKLDDERKELMKIELRRVLAKPSLSPNLYEIVSKILGE